MGPYSVCIMDTGSNNGRSRKNVRSRYIKYTRISDATKMLHLSPGYWMYTGKNLTVIVIISDTEFQCNVKKCFKSYHVTCGVRNGHSVHMEQKGGKVELISNCDKHTETKNEDARKRKTSIDMQVDEER